MATPVTSATTVPTTVTLPTTTTTAASSTGVSSVATTLASSAASTAAASRGFFAPVWDCLDYIRNCLSKLPFIGWIFGSSAASTTATSTAGSTTGVTSAQWTDAELVNMIRGQFIQAGAVTSAGTAPVVPNADTVTACLNLFGQIQAPAEKMKAFILVQNAVNGLDAITKQFYDAMDTGMQTAFRQAIYVANGSSDDYAGNSRWPQVGDYVVNNDIRSAIAKAAATQYLAALNAVTATSASTTGVTSSTTATTSTTI